MNLSCVWAPEPCLQGAADAVLSWLPFGLYGLVFFGGMIVGERIGKLGISTVVVGWFLMRFASKSPLGHEHVDGKDAEPSPPKPRKHRPTIFGK